MKRKPKTKAGKKAKMQTVMHEFKQGKLRSGSKEGPEVTNPKQAIAIGLKQSGQGKSPRTAKSPAARRKKLDKVKF